MTKDKDLVKIFEGNLQSMLRTYLMEKIMRSNKKAADVFMKNQYKEIKEKMFNDLIDLVKEESDCSDFDKSMFIKSVRKAFSITSKTTL